MVVHHCRYCTQNGVYGLDDLLSQDLLKNVNDSSHLLHRVIVHKRNTRDPVVQIKLRLEMFNKGVRIEVAIPYPNLIQVHATR